MAPPQGAPDLCPHSFTRRRPERPTTGRKDAETAALLGRSYIPFQRDIADVAGEYDPETGIPFYRTIVVSIMRRQGKTVLVFTRMVRKCLERRAIVPYSAQSGNDGRHRLLREFKPLLEESPHLSRTVRHINKSRGDEHVEFANGSLLPIVYSGSSGAHGDTFDDAFIDEFFDDKSEADRLQGIIPTTLTVPDAQLWIASNAGTEESVPLNAMRERGELANSLDTGEGMAYFEYRAPPGWDLDNPLELWGFMPALGYTITPQAVMAARATFDNAAEYMRAYGNITQGSGLDLFAEGKVAQALQRFAGDRPPPQLFALDVTLDRSHGAVAWRDSDQRVGLSDWLPLEEIVERVNELTDKYRVPVHVAAGSPAASLEDLKRSIPMSGADVSFACGQMFDAIVAGRAQIQAGGVIAGAISGAQKHTTDRGSWTWRRKGVATDPAPLYAVTLARFADPDARPEAADDSVVSTYETDDLIVI